jgi:hypothetical protein
LCALLGHLHGRACTGTLRLTGVEISGGAPRVTVRELMLGDGALLGMTSNVDAEALGPVLLRRGVLTPTDLMTAGVRAREGRQPLEWVLDELGLLGPERRREALLHSAIEALVHVFAWTDGAYTFEDGLGDPHAREVPLAEIMTEVVTRLGGREVERALGDLARPLRKGLLPGQGADPVAASLLASAERSTTARQAVSSAPGARPEAERQLLLLLCLGALVFAEPGDAMASPSVTEAAIPRPPWEQDQAPPAPPPPARTRTKAPAAPAAPAAPRAKATPRAPAPTPPAPPPPVPVEERRREILAAHAALPGATHFEVLGLSRAATEAEIKSAYVRLARTFHPDSQGDPGLSDVRDILMTLFVAVGEAHQTLKDPASRAAYEATLPRLRPPAASATSEAPSGEPASGGGEPPEETVLRAHAALGRKDVYEAIQILESVITQPTVRPELRRSSLVLLARAYRMSENRTRDAERILLEVVTEDSRNIPAYVALANLYKEEGMRSRAVRMFRKVLELDPQHRQALEESVGLK